MQCCCLQKNDCQPDIQLSIICLREFLVPFVLSSCLSFFSLRLQHEVPFFPRRLTPPRPLLSFHPFTRSLRLNLPQLSEMSALTMLPLLPISFPFTSFTPTSLSRLHLSLLFQVNAAVASDLKMYQFVWTGSSFFSLAQGFLPPHYRIYLHLPLIPSSLCAFLSLLLLV